MVNLAELRLRAEASFSSDGSFDLCASLLQALHSGRLTMLAATARREGLRESASVLARADTWFCYPPPRSGSVATATAEQLASAGVEVPTEAQEVLRVLAGLMVRVTPPGAGSQLRFRNVDVDPADPVGSWPHEALETAMERWRTG